MDYNNTDIFLLNSIITGMGEILETHSDNLQNPAVNEIYLAMEPKDSDMGACAFVLKLDKSLKTVVVNLERSSSAGLMLQELNRLHSSKSQVIIIQDSKILESASIHYTASTGMTLESGYPVYQKPLSLILAGFISDNVDKISAWLESTEVTRDVILFGRQSVNFEDGSVMEVDHGVFHFSNGINLRVSEYNADGSFNFEPELTYMLYRSAKRDTIFG